MSGAFVQALVVSWRRWGDLLVDTGRELDLPRRLAAGDLLYRDARFYYGPLAPYLNAVLYHLFGVHADVLIWAGIASAALFSVALYRLATSFMAPWAGATIVVSCIYLCLFAHLFVGAIFNFVLPYTFAATYGIVAAIWSLVLLVRHVRTGRRAPFLASVACLALAALSKLEAFAAVAAAHAVFLAAMLFLRSDRRRLYLSGYGAAATLVVAVYGGFWAAVGPGLWHDNLAGVVNQGSRTFVVGVMGLGDISASLAAMGVSAALLVGVLGLCALVARRLRNVPATTAWLVSGSVGILTFAAYRQWQLHVHFRALPVVMLGTAVALGVLFVRQRDRRREWLPHLLLWTFGFACLWRIPFNSRPHHYGFYLLPAGLVCFGVLLFDYGPRFLGAGPRAGRAFGAAALGLFASSVTIAYADSRQLDSLNTRDLATPRAHLRILDRWGLEAAAVRALEELPQGTGVVAIPQGAGLLFVSGARPADTMFSYLPMEIPGRARDTELLERWRGNPPDVVVWTTTPLEEFGSAGFGRDYAHSAAQWLLTEYAPATEPTEPIVFLVRRQKLLRSPALRAIKLSPSDDGAAVTITGRVLESYDSPDSTFILLETATERRWARVPPAAVTRGSTVTVFDGMPGTMEDRGLRRRFERLIVGRLDPPIVPVTRLRAEKDSFKDKDVAILGKVVEVLPSSGRVHRARVRDSAASGPGAGEIVVLTLEPLNVGDAVHVRGRLLVGGDFGAGFADALVLDSYLVTR